MVTTTGKIANYDKTTGSGFILPETGGQRLPFNRADLPQGGQPPQEKDRYEYETTGEGDDCCAVKMRKV